MEGMHRQAAWNALEHAIVLSPGETVEAAALPERVRTPKGDPLVSDRPIANPTLEAIELMKAKRIGCLPVTAERRLIGIVTEHDFLRVASILLEQRLREDEQAQADSGSGPTQQADQPGLSPAASSSEIREDRTSQGG